MESQQIVDYIRQNLQAGHPEANIKSHMLANGWTQGKVDAAFKQYHKQNAPAPKSKSKAKTNPIKRKLQQRPNLRKRARSRRLKAGVVLVVVVLAAAAIIGHRKLANRKQPVAVVPAQVQTPAQKQSSDIINIAGAIDQYMIANNNVQPNMAVATPDGGLRICANVCDPTVPEVSPLTVYNPVNVHFASYSPGLGVPDISVMYIVPGAECKGKPPIVAQSSNPRSMVILYAVESEPTMKQRCAQL